MTFSIATTRSAVIDPLSEQQPMASSYFSFELRHRTLWISFPLTPCIWFQVVFFPQHDPVCKYIQQPLHPTILQFLGREGHSAHCWFPGRSCKSQVSCMGTCLITLLLRPALQLSQVPSVSPLHSACCLPHQHLEPKRLHEQSRWRMECKPYIYSSCI